MRSPTLPAAFHQTPCAAFLLAAAAAWLAAAGCAATTPTSPPSRAGGTPVAAQAPVATTAAPAGQAAGPPAASPARAPALSDRYAKSEHMVSMRDGARLYTCVYAPRDRTQPWPILLVRTPYSCAPYGPDAYRDKLGPEPTFDEEGYIFVFQDVRGCYLSEGEFVNMRPHRTAKRDASDVDESSDTFDTIEWLLSTVPGHNGRVGMWGISYPGFYAAAGMIDAHPALVAVSPQAPIADWWYDDFHHHGAFFLPHSFGFMSTFGLPRPEPSTERPPRPFDFGTPDGYRFYLDLGPLRNADEKYLRGSVAFWQDLVDHPDYDAFWQERNLLPHLDRVAPAVLVVGGWFDAEDLYGTLAIYRAIERRNPGVSNSLVMGPWYHGGWVRSSGERLGDVAFGGPTSAEFQRDVLRPFFRHHLKGDRGAAAPPIAEATMFETGSNRWRSFAEWPPSPPATREADLHLHAGGGLSFDPPDAGGQPFDEYVSDPARPVPFTSEIARGMTRQYMTDDQRFAARRPDVLVYQTAPLTDPVTLAGPITADLWVSTSGTDSDWVVKLIDVFPGNASDPEGLREGMHMGDYQMMVRSEVLRGRYRNNPRHPEPFAPGVPTRLSLPLQDVLHTFGAGHRIMVQIQSTWFPLVDRNPQTFVPNIFLADEDDFVKAVQRVYASPGHPSALRVTVLPGAAE